MIRFAWLSAWVGGLAGGQLNGGADVVIKFAINYSLQTNTTGADDKQPLLSVALPYKQSVMDREGLL